MVLLSPCGVGGGGGVALGEVLAFAEPLLETRGWGHPRLLKGVCVWGRCGGEKSARPLLNFCHPQACVCCLDFLFSRIRCIMADGVLAGTRDHRMPAMYIAKKKKSVPNLRVYEMFQECVSQ